MILALRTEFLINGVFDDMVSIAKSLKKTPRVRKNIFIIFGSISSITFFSLITNYLFNDNYLKFFYVSLFLFVLSFSIFLPTSMSYIIDDPKTLSERLEMLAEEREELTKKIKRENDVMDVIKMNLNQLTEYYTINKVQAKKSYSFSIFMIIIGFIILIAGIALWFYGRLGTNITIIASLSGVIAEFIGATSLLLYKESSKQIQIFFDKLSYLQHVMLAVELSERLNDDKKIEQISTIISSLVDYKTKDPK